MEKSEAQWDLPADQSGNDLWDESITDVAVALGYKDLIDYNDECLHSPREVRKAIREL